jgi:hypothetical protein
MNLLSGGYKEEVGIHVNPSRYSREEVSLSLIGRNS